MFVRTPGREADSPKPWRVAATAGAGLALGMALVMLFLTGDEARPKHPTEQPTIAASTARRPARAGTETDEWQKDDASTAADDHAGDEHEATESGPPLDNTRSDAAVSAPDPRPRDTAPRRLKRPARKLVLGRVAYLRCEGLPTRRGPYPCPRDRDLEAAVWEQLREATHCPLALGFGSADLRLDFRDTAVDRLRILKVRGSHALSEEALERCSGQALRGLRTRLQPRHMVVSFRFSFEPLP